MKHSLGFFRALGVETNKSPFLLSVLVMKALGCLLKKVRKGGFISFFKVGGKGDKAMEESDFFS